jgi:monofunctional biosynthetic peptidoglycan transglycosylase
MTALIFDFGNDRDIAEWIPVNDVIMGGVSDGRLEPTGTGTAAFSGVVSLEQGGGFASVRSRPQSRDLSGYSSLELRVRGDGRRYKINLKTDARANGILYTALLEARAGEWRTVRLPFEEFRPTFRGRVSPDAEPLDLSRVVSFGLMISDRQAGPFRLELATIGIRAEVL